MTKSDDDTDAVELVDAMMMDLEVVISRGFSNGWTDHHRYESGRFRETIVERWMNLVSLLGPLGISYLII